MQKGLNNQIIQQSNRSLILGMIIDRGIVTRKEMIELSGLHKPTITNIVNELLEMNVIEKCIAPLAENQRKVDGFTVKTRKIKILSARWTRTFFRVSLYTLRNEVDDSEFFKINTDENIHITVSKILETIDRLLERHHTNHILGMCVGIPGPYIRGERNIALVPGYENLEKIDIQKVFSDRFPFPVITEHDAHLSALAEWKKLSIEERNSCTCLLALQSIGIGIGAGVILNGKIVEGAIGIAGEIGQMGIWFSGPKNKKGYRGVWENYASSASVKDYLRMRLHEFPNTLLSETSTYEEIVDAYENHDLLAEWAFDCVAAKMAYGIANVIFTINPGLILIGPEYPQTQNFINTIKKYVDDLMDSRISNRVTIRYSNITKDPTLEGGYYFVIDHLLHDQILFNQIKEIMQSSSV